MPEHDHHQSPDFTIDLNVNVRLPGLAPFLLTFLTNQGKIMADIQALLAKVGELEAQNIVLNNKVEEGNNKTDLLITAAGETKAELIALQGQVNPDLQPIIDRIDNVINSQKATVASIGAQESETDAATGADGPGAATGDGTGGAGEPTT